MQPPVPPAGMAALAGFHPLLARLLYNRGIRSRAEADAFLSAGRELCADPYLLPDMDAAVTRLFRALRSGETIAVFGDFDCDGVTAAAVLTLGLEALGGRVIPYIPDRVSEGHGLNVPALTALRQQGASLVVTADCGISSVAEVEQAPRTGLDVIITDHHTVPPIPPPALAVVNARRADSHYPSPELASVGVAYKVVQGLYQALGRPEPERLLDLVAVGTVADMALLLHENRYLVSRGLAQVNRAERAGFRALMEQAGLRPGSIDAEAVSFSLAPRLNAAGRMDHASTSYRLLVTTSAEEAQQLAARLESQNAERRRLTEELSARAREQVGRETLAPLLMVAGREYPPGVVGLVASRLVEEFGRPAVAVAVGERTSRGSCRSIPEFNIVAALARCRDLFAQFGGHAQAAGFTIENERLDELRRRLVENAAQELAGVELRPTLTIDAEVAPSALVGSLWREVQRMTPFGAGNPPPTFLSRSVQVLDRRGVGADGRHLSLKLKHQGAVWSGIAFGLGGLAMRLGDRVDVVYTLVADDWNGEKTLKLNVLDAASSP
ncbi:MAG: single-stranded-DNA-specific exonuclease RecJ [Chloroflexi bacterium]|nr:single-stranded-DNA-specific exonuclease RecJ [Chloroflexota bacterium]